MYHNLFHSRCSTLTNLAMMHRFALLLTSIVLSSCTQQSSTNTQKLIHILDTNTETVFNHAKFTYQIFTPHFSERPRLTEYVNAMNKARNATVNFMAHSLNETDLNKLHSEYQSTLDEIYDAYVLNAFDSLSIPEDLDFDNPDLAAALMRNNLVLLLDEFIENCASAIDGPCSVKICDFCSYSESRTDSTYVVSMTSNLMYGSGAIPEYTFDVDSVLNEAGNVVLLKPEVSEFIPHIDVTFTDLPKGDYRAFFSLKGNAGFEFVERSIEYEFKIDK